MDTNLQQLNLDIDTNIEKQPVEFNIVENLLKT